jgi:hypothetical protein
VPLGAGSTGEIAGEQTASRCDGACLLLGCGDIAWFPEKEPGYNSNISHPILQDIARCAQSMLPCCEQCVHPRLPLCEVCVCWLVVAILPFTPKKNLGATPTFGIPTFKPLHALHNPCTLVCHFHSFLPYGREFPRGSVTARSGLLSSVTQVCPRKRRMPK